MTDATKLPPNQATTKRTKRRHPALGARVATAGLGVSALFGIVGALGASAQHQEAPPTQTQPTGPIVVVVHHTAADPGPSTDVGGGASSDQVLDSIGSSAPIELKANPVVQRVETSSAPVARTNGSR